MKVAAGKRVKIEYEVRLASGQVIESSAERGPVDYVHGAGTMIPALEQRIEGLGVDEERQGTIPADQIFTDPSALPTEVVSRSEFGGEQELEVGKRFEAQRDGATLAFEVVSIDGDEVTVRFCAKDVAFRVKVLDVADGDKPPPVPA